MKDGTAAFKQKYVVNLIIDVNVCVVEMIVVMWFPCDVC